MKTSDALEKIRASVEEVCCHSELLRNHDPAYNDLFETNLRECFAIILTQLQDAAKELVNDRHLGIKKSVDINFAVVE